MSLASEHLEVNMLGLVTLLPQIGGAESTYHADLFSLIGIFLSVCKWKCFSVQ